MLPQYGRRINDAHTNTHTRAHIYTGTTRDKLQLEQQQQQWIVTAEPTHIVYMYVWYVHT